MFLVYFMLFQSKLALLLNSGKKLAKASCQTGWWRWFGSVLTPFARCPVLAVLGAVALHHLPLSVIPLDGERHAQDVITGLDDAQDAPHTVPLLLWALPSLQILHQLVLYDSGPAVEEALDHPEEVRVVGLVCCVGIATDPHQGRGRRESGIHAPRGQGTTRRAAQQLPEIPIHD